MAAARHRTWPTGEFRSLFDFLERTRLKWEPIENLIACGAFDAPAGVEPLGCPKGHTPEDFEKV